MPLPWTQSNVGPNVLPLSVAGLVAVLGLAPDGASLAQAQPSLPARFDSYIKLTSS